MPCARIGASVLCCFIPLHPSLNAFPSTRSPHDIDEKKHRKTIAPRASQCDGPNTSLFAENCLRRVEWDAIATVVIFDSRCSYPFGVSVICQAISRLWGFVFRSNGAEPIADIIYCGKVHPCIRQSSHLFTGQLAKGDLDFWGKVPEFTH